MGDGGWSRIILEKPFGHDLKSAQELNAVVHGSFDEKNVFRIDHYLGKETVQNILVFRFGNSLFEPVWNRNYIDHVEITAAETVGVEGRAGFYEETGALRDMVANHLLQLLALTAMEPPIEFEADSVRGQKVQVLKSIRPMTVEEVAKRTVRGQYGPGQIGGKPVPGYREEKGVKKDSVTETYAAVEFYVDNWRWAGVPFYIRTGKHLPRQVSEIRVHFKRTPQALFSATPYEHVGPNVITLRIQPDDGISIAFDVKQPGDHMRALTVAAKFPMNRPSARRGRRLMKRFCSIRCVARPRCSRAMTKWRRNGESSRPSKRPGHNCPRPRFPTTPLGRKGRSRPKRSSPATIADGIGYRNRGVDVIE